MKVLRLLFWFCLGVFLSGYTVFSYAETIPASGGQSEIYQMCYTSTALTQWGPKSYGANTLAARTAACGAVGGTIHDGMDCWLGATQSTRTICGGNTEAHYYCPDAQGWSYDSAARTCSRPDCVLPNERDPADGVCKLPPNKCAAKKDQYSDGWVSVPAGAAMPVGAVCLDGCEANRALSLGGPDDGMGLGKGVDWWPIGQTFTGAVCSGVDIPLPLGTDPAKVPPKPAKKPVCAPGEGVMTSSSGKVLCVPEGVPGVSKPVVRKSEEVQTFPDGSTKKTTTTTTTDPNTGAKDVQSSAVSSGGQSGTAGTTTTNGGTSSDGDGDGEPDGGGGSFGEYGELYKKKYPDGIKGVLDQKLAGFKSSGVYSTINQLVPTTLPNSGTCPSYSFSMNIGPKMMFGSSKLDMPCAVWSFIRIVLLITASLVARRLVFGG